MFILLRVLFFCVKCVFWKGGYYFWNLIKCYKCDVNNKSCGGLWDREFNKSVICDFLFCFVLRYYMECFMLFVEFVFFDEWYCLICGFCEDVEEEEEWVFIDFGEYFFVGIFVCEDVEDVMVFLFLWVFCGRLCGRLCGSIVRCFVILERLGCVFFFL